MTPGAFITENVANHSDYHSEREMACNYNMTPTPLTDINHSDYDIYDGVIEVEHSQIIEEGDFSDFYHEEYDDNDDDDMLRQHDRDSVVRHTTSPRSRHHNEVVANTNDDSMKSTDLYHAIIDDEQFIMELNEELRLNGYENPELILQDLMEEQIEIDRKYFTQKECIICLCL